MAQVQSSEGVASVTPQVQAPDDSQRIQANPAEFGGQIAQGMERLGAGVSQAGEGAFDISKFWGQIQADGAMNDANQRAIAQVEDFKKLQGADALDAQQGMLDSVKKIYQEGRSGLKTPLAQYQFDQGTRSYYQRFLEPQIYSHANQQAFVHAKTTNENTIKQGMDTLAANADDPEKANDALQIVLSGAGRNAHLILGENASEGDVDAYMRPYLQNALKTQAQAISVKDPVGAVKFLDENRERIGVDYPALSAQFRARATEAQALGIANDAFSSTANAMQGASPNNDNASAVREAILMQESGNTGPNPGQVQPGTFAQYAREGENLNNPADARAVSSRIVDDLSKRFDGDPARIAVGYFSGPGNVAPAGSSTPWISDVKDANGKSVSSYVQDITSRLNAHGALLAAKAGVYDQVLQRTEGNPVLRQAALREVNQRYNAAETASLASQAARKAVQDQTLRDMGDKIAAGMPINPRSDPNLSEEQVEHLETLQRAALNDQVNGRPGDYGPGYADVQKRIYSTGQDRIVNQEQLLSLAASGQLNPAGYAEASKHLKEVNAPGAEADRVLQSNFYKSAEKAVTLESDLVPGLKRPGGAEQWNQALPVLNKALAEGRAKGLTNTELMDPANKNSAWTALKPFLPSAAEARAAQMRDTISHDAATAGAIDLTKIDKLEDALAAYNQHRITRDQARELVSKHPEWNVTMPTAENGPKVPVQ